MPGRFGIDRYLNIRTATGPSFSPDGRFVSFLTNITGAAQLWRVPADGGWPSQLTFTGESVRAAHYSPRRHELIFAMDAGGNERTQLYRLRGVGSDTNHDIGEGWLVEDLSRQPQAIHSFGGWSHDGEHFAFSANREDPGRFDVYVQDVKAPEARLLSRGPGGYYQAVGWSHDDRWLLVHRNESNFNQDLYLVEVTTGKARHLTPHQGDVQYYSPCWSSDSRQVFCASTHGGRDLTGLAAIDVASGKLTYLDTPEHEVEAVYASPKAPLLAWLLNVGGRSEL